MVIAASSRCWCRPPDVPVRWNMRTVPAPSWLREWPARPRPEVLCSRTKMTKPSKPEAGGVRERLDTLRSSLLVLHKALVESERVEYEKTIGKIQSPTHFLHLLTNDPWFAWLSPLSQLIVSIDEALDAEEPLTAANVDRLVKESAGLLVASESGAGFSQHFFEALQRDPDVVMAQGNVTKLPGWPRPPASGPPEGQSE